MTGLIVGRALMGLVMALERPLEALAHATALRAAGKRQEQKMLVTFELAVSKEQFARLRENPDIRQGLHDAEWLKRAAS